MRRDPSGRVPGAAAPPATQVTVPVQQRGRLPWAVTAGWLPDQLRRSLTWTRGMELARHEIVTARTGPAIYVADPVGLGRCCEPGDRPARRR